MPEFTVDGAGLVEMEPAPAAPHRRRAATARSATVRGARNDPRSGPPRHRVKARTVLSAESLAERGDVEPASAEASTAVRLLRRQREAARAHAALLRDVATLWVDRDDADQRSDREESDLLVAAALRTTTGRAAHMLRDAHMAVTDVPLTLGRLEAGEMPAEWFEQLLRSLRSLSSEQRRQVDERVTEWDLASIPADRFRRELRLLVAYFTDPDRRPSPQEQRNVVLEMSPENDGTACLRITGPVPEMLSLSRRVDSAARAVQAAQRRALEEGTEVPFDADGAAKEAGAPATLAALRYRILTGSVLDTGGIEAPRERFRINVVVPVLTLMGAADVPATIDGTSPIPADMARELAAGETTWYRVLTDPSSGAFLPLPADRYRPTTAMLEHLRLRHPVCAVPGCSRPTSSNAEGDHIVEYDHADPQRGGATSVDNMHLMCCVHHALKTERRIDPIRGPDPGSTSWHIGEHAMIRTTDNRDLTTPEIAHALADSWEEYEWAREIDALFRSGEVDRLFRESGPIDDPAEAARAHDPPY